MIKSCFYALDDYEEVIVAGVLLRVDVAFPLPLSIFDVRQFDNWHLLSLAA